MTDLDYMKIAYDEAMKCIEIDEVPIGAIIVRNGEIIAKAYNKRESTQMAINHAEMIVIQEACEKLHSWRLDDCTLYSTLEPCVMCSGTLLSAKVKRVVYGASSRRWPALHKVLAHNTFNYKVEVVGGVYKTECQDLISSYFKERRKKEKQLKEQKA